MEITIISTILIILSIFDYSQSKCTTTTPTITTTDITYERYLELIDGKLKMAYS